MAKACHLIETAEDMPNLDALAAAAGMSRFHFHRVFKTLTGVTPKAYALAHRAAKLKDRLANTATVTEAIFDAGYGSSGRFYADSSARLGMTPQSYKAGGEAAALKAMGHA